MIILQIDVDGILAFERKSQAPIARDGNGVAASSITRESVESVRDDVHVLRAGCLIEERELTVDPAHLEHFTIAAIAKLLQVFNFAAFSKTNRYPLRRKMLLSGRRPPASLFVQKRLSALLRKLAIRPDCNA